MFFVMWIDAIFGVVFDKPKLVLAVKVVAVIWGVCLIALGIAFIVVKYSNPNVRDVFFTVLYGSLLVQCVSMLMMALVGRAQQRDKTRRIALARMAVAVALLALSFAIRLPFTVAFELLYNQGPLWWLFFNLGLAVPLSLSFFVLLVIVGLTYYKGRTNASRSEMALAEHKRTSAASVNRTSAAKMTRISEVTENLLPFDSDSRSSEYDSELSFKSTFGDRVPTAYEV